MHNHFWNIGFQVKSSSEYKELAMLALEHGEVVARRGELQYECWTVGNAELWLQTLAGSEITAKRIIDLSPHYAGKTQIDVHLKRRVVREKASPLDFAYVAYLSIDECPLVLDVPLVHKEPILPCSAKVQITAFAHDMSVFANERVYDEEKQIGKKGWQARPWCPVECSSQTGRK